MRRRLRFDCRMAENESIVGAVFRAASRHVLHSTFPALKDAGVSRKSIRFMQILPEESIIALADVIRCDPKRLARDAGIRLGNSGPDERGRQRIAFGDLIIEGSHLDHKRRRVSPISLQESAHHKTDWLNRLLPFCPFSFELLIEKCPACNGALGWQKPNGVETCEHCDHDLRSAPSESLDRRLIADYRDFADLCSFNIVRRNRILGKLPHPINEIPAGTLVRFALHVGRMASGAEKMPETHMPDLPPEELARIVSSGMSMLKGWPDAFHAWVVNEAHVRETDERSYSDFRSDLRTLSRCIGREPGSEKICYPRLRTTAHSATGFDAAPLGVYSQDEARRRLGIGHETMSILRETGLLDCRSFQEGGQVSTLYRFDAHRIDEIANALEGSVHHWEFWRKFRVPSYGVEQLACLGLIECITDPVVTQIKNEVMIPKSELVRLEEKVMEKRKRGKAPASAKSLRVLANEVGGRVKPWGPIFAQLMLGRVPFWVRPGGVTTQHILLKPDDWTSLCSLTFDRKDYPAFAFKREMNSSDVAEITNLQPAEARKLRGLNVLKARPYKLTLKHDVDEVLQLAGDWVSVTELMRRSAMGDRVIKKKLAAANIPSKATMWERRAAEIVCQL